MAVSHSLKKAQVERYSRQLLVPNFGISGQDALCKGSVLIVGAGGLGCPAALYLAGAGVGRVGIVDYDTVEVTNLHRQVLHPERNISRPKAVSACEYLQAMNSTCDSIPHVEKFSVENAVHLISQYDVVIDASDNAVTRYLINDACIVAGKPLVSGAALRWEGQLTTYNHNSGPCYRCLYPTPPPAAAITNCDAGGVLGPITGVIGSLQALEAIRILSKQPALYAGKMLTFDGQTGTFRTLKLRPKQADCLCSSSVPQLPEQSYEVFCGASATDKTPACALLQADQRITPSAFKTLRSDALLIDVRPVNQYEICHIDDSVNIPFADLSSSIDCLLSQTGNNLDHPIVTVCRRGNQSQHAVVLLRKYGFTNVRDIIGGMRQWALEVDPDCPIY